jgi:hypothetical protein
MLRLLVENAEEYKSALPETGIFEKFDCNLDIICPEDTPLKEIDEISFFTRACINVVDITVKNAETKYNMIQVDLTEVPVHIAERRPERGLPRPAPKAKAKPKPRPKNVDDTPTPPSKPDSDLTD